jgi:type IV pilus assembly protein PilA
MNKKRTQGFTLIEVLVVIAIISVLITILLPSFNAARKKPYDVASQQCIKAIVTAAVTYRSEHNDAPANSVSQLNNTDVNEQCQNIQVHHFDSSGLSPATTGDGTINYDGNRNPLFLAWSASGNNLYEVNFTAAERIHPIRWN